MSNILYHMIEIVVDGKFSKLSQFAIASIDYVAILLLLPLADHR